MVHRLCGLTMMAALVSMATASARGDNTLYQGYGAGPAPSAAARPRGAGQDWASFPPPAAGVRVGESGWPAAGVPQAPQNRRLPFPSSGQRWQPAETSRATSWDTPIRLPQVEPRVPLGVSRAAAGPAFARPVHGAWREPDRERIDPRVASVAQPAYTPPGRITDDSWLENDRGWIDSSGASFAGAALARPGDASWGENDGPYVDSRHGREGGPVEARPVQSGVVYGRLVNKKRPLVNCRVAIVPLKRNGKNYTVDGARRPLNATTNDRGEYRFENVPAGAYKLTWLPRGTNQWIRRVRWKPDAVVHNDEVVGLKEIRVALQTIN